MLVETFKNIVITNTGNAGEVEKEMASNSLMLFLVAITLFIILQFFVGPWLWNNVLKRLFPGLKLGVARWYDIVLLNLILTLVLPPTLVK